MASFTKTPPPNRLKNYKTKGNDLEELRRRKEEEGSELRKSRREDQVFKRRNILSTSSDTSLNGDSDHTHIHTDTPIEILAKDTYSTDINVLITTLRSIRKQLCVEYDPPISRLIDTGVLPQLVQLMLDKQQESTILFEVCWIITNVCGGTSYHTRCAVEVGVVPLLINLMTSCHVTVQEQAVWALSNIAGDGTQCRDIVLGFGVMDPLLIILTDDDVGLPLKRNGVWLLSSLCRGKDPPPNEMIIFKALHVLARVLVMYNDQDILSDASWAIAYLSEGSDKRIERVINAGVVKRLVELLMHPETSVVIPALRAIGNILTGADPLTQVVINCSVLMPLRGLLQSPVDQVKKECCWALSNITAGNKIQIQAALDAGVLPIVLEIIETTAYKIRKEAAWVALNAIVGGTNEQIVYIVNCGIIKPLCELLGVHDPRVVLVSLEAVECVLKAGNAYKKEYSTLIEEAHGIDKIESLAMSHPLQDVNDLAQRILDRYLYSDIGLQIDSSDSLN